MSFSLTQESDAPTITPAVQWLIALNVAIYFLQLTLVQPVDMLGALGFHLRDLQGAWWTLVTYMFVHVGFWHLTFNMLLLWLFGRRLEHQWGSQKLALFYLWCGLGGVLFHLLFAREAALAGASAAVLGLLLAYGMEWPDEEVLFMWLVPMKVRWLVAITVLVNLTMGVAGMFAAGGGEGARVAYMAHLGGLAFGWLYLRRPMGQRMERLRQRVSQVPDVPDDETPRAVPRASPRPPRERLSDADEAVAKSNALAGKPRAGVSSLAGPAPTDARTEALNSVLDKISEHGMESLTMDERRLLDEMSRELRGER